MRRTEIAQYVLAGIVVVGFFTILGVMCYLNKTGVDILIGSLAAAFGGVVGYFFGSSAGSARKDVLLAQSMPVTVDKS